MNNKDNKVRRSYTSESRETQAALTRNRILISARKLFEAEGFERATIEKLAQTAEVSMPTIYALFKSKRGVLGALMDEAFPAHHVLHAETKQEKSPKKRLMIAAKMSRQMYDIERTQLHLFQSAAVLAPEFKQLEKEREERRYTRLEESIKTMALEKSFKKELDPSKAHDILWALTGRDLYRMLVIEQHWNSDEYENWLSQILIKTLIDDDYNEL
ncbi:MAG: TetR/AcrR family transcriptional regulator [Alphaproteobacteria bacterium]|nr:TetR/AcrR family transcriptional regulator [Alphaproteobacteria bacterium]